MMKGNLARDGRQCGQEDEHGEEGGHLQKEIGIK